MNNKQKFNKICKDIKEIKIQGAKNVSIAGFKAYKLIPTKSSKKKLLSLRSTEPMLFNILKIADKISYKDLMKKIKQNQDNINKETFRIIRNNPTIFVHCHSSTLINALIYAKKYGKKFEVYNTETRPLFQGRKTSEELKKAGIKVTMFVDSAAATAIEKENKKDKIHADMVFLGADAILKKGVMNKIGSGMFAKIAKDSKIPVYIIADSWKYFPKEIKIEERNPKEIWNNPNIRIENPAFEFVPKKYIARIISELGNLSYSQFLKKVKR